MVFKFVVLCAALAVAKAGYLGAPATYAPGPAVAAAPALAYSAAPAVSHISYSSPIVSYGAPLAAHTPAITSQSANTFRSFGNLGQVSTYTKTVDTPFSSVRKSDVRVSNPGLRIAAAAPVAYAAPAIHAAPAYAAPAYAAYHAPAVAAYHAGPAVAAYHAPAAVAHAPVGLGVAYSAAPAVAHFTYSGSYGLNYAY